MYILDSNIFIQAHRSYYPFDVVPSFWKKLEELSHKGVISSIDKVKMEICDRAYPDELANWCADRLPNNFFKDSSISLDSYSELVHWTENSYFNQRAKDEFLTTDLADPWLIAVARTNNYTVVTHETSNPNRVSRIKIPEPCIHFGVRYIDGIQMFRDLAQSF